MFVAVAGGRAGTGVRASPVVTTEDKESKQKKERSLQILSSVEFMKIDDCRRAGEHSEDGSFLLQAASNEPSDREGNGCTEQEKNPKRRHVGQFLEAEKTGHELRQSWKKLRHCLKKSRKSE